jgi:cytochrome c5
MRDIRGTRYAATALALLALTACGGKGEPPTAAAPAPQAAAVAAPALDAALQPLYDTYCRVCHGTEGTGAPYSGRRADWEARAATGMATLLKHSMDGFNGMPPMGGCFTCTEQDMRALITYLSGGLAH